MVYEWSLNAIQGYFPNGIFQHFLFPEFPSIWEQQTNSRKRTNGHKGYESSLCTRRVEKAPGCPASDLPRLPGPGHRTPSLERNTSGAESTTSSAKPPALLPAPRSLTPRPVASFLAKLPLWSLVPPEASVSSAHLQKFQAGLAPRLASAKTIYPGRRLRALAE